MSKRYYVIWRANPWVLNLDGFKNQPDAVQAINWQERGGDSHRHEWAVCERTGPNTFKTIDNHSHFTVADRGGYTEKAWNEFLAGWKEQ